MFSIIVAALTIAPCIAFEPPQHADLRTWVPTSTPQSSLNFTQYICSGGNALNDCESSTSKGCKATTHEQGACLTSGGGKQSLTVTCKQTPLGMSVNIVVYPGVQNCTGTPNPFQEKADFCYQSGGGKEFFKYECEKSLAATQPQAHTSWRTIAASVATGIGITSPSAKQIHMMIGWIQAEKGGAQCNALGCTLELPGSSKYNGANVQNYPNAGDGIHAVVATLTTGHHTAHGYDPIVAALKAGDPKHFCHAIGSSAWGTPSGGPNGACATVTEAVAQTGSSPGWGSNSYC